MAVNCRIMAIFVYPFSFAKPVMKTNQSDFHQQNVPAIKVGIVAAPAITVRFNGNFREASAGTLLTLQATDAPSTFTPLEPDATFTILNVTIGIDFHWERNEDQTFFGSLSILPLPDGRIQAVNTIDIERYLSSVISSEMNAQAPAEFLKAHAIISRSWVLAQLRQLATEGDFRTSVTDDEIVRWYDREAHQLFDVCADDHCQRYQGCTKASTPQVAQAIESTRGLALTDTDGNMCDARFSKCCGGATELFSSCWQPVDLPYLASFRDRIPELPAPDLTLESEAARWIGSRPEAFCARPPREVLETVLNNYDLETPDFYRWRVSYTADELDSLVAGRSGIDFGHITALQPLRRGPSARIIRLLIKGTKRSIIIGKELEIRRTLSASHLYSSAFTAEIASLRSDGTPDSWILSGAGWGHGVGLCQIGAAVMAHRGYSCNNILSHYFPGSCLKKLY